MRASKLPAALVDNNIVHELQVFTDVLGNARINVINEHPCPEPSSVLSVRYASRSGGLTECRTKPSD